MSLLQHSIQSAAKHLNDILSIVINHTAQQAAVVVSDTQCPLAIVLTKAYQVALPNAQFIDFERVHSEEILEKFKTLASSDLVVLIQSTSFRLEAFRIRIELFKRSLKVIEHPHLSRMTDEQIDYYIDALAYDPNYYRQTGNALKYIIDNAKGGVVDSGEGCKLIFDSPFEKAKLNIGDYTNMTNIGGQFPIGEVFTEAQDLEAVHGKVRIFVFGDTLFNVNKPPQPITLVITNGQVTDVINSTIEFDLVLSNIRADEGVVWLRELGFGMNRAFTQTRMVNDIGTYERMCGIHLSLGSKHGVYNKPLFKRAHTKHHVDVFAVTDSVTLDDKLIYHNGSWIAS